MTNYNERLDEVLIYVINEGWFLRSKTDYPNGFTNADVRNIQDKAKQATTSLIKELVAEAKPRNSETQRGSVTVYGDLNERDLNIINLFEQNLLKALEEV